MFLLFRLVTVISLNRLNSVDKVADNERKNVKNDADVIPTTDSRIKNVDDVSVESVNQQVEDLLSKFGPSSNSSSMTSEVSGDIDISAYISADSQTQRKGLFD